jgi:hypothetical protein
MKYEGLEKEDFDALVTGELTHYALWLEEVTNEIIITYFSMSKRGNDFRRLILYREGLTFQDKLDIVRGMIPLFEITEEKVRELKSLIKRVEEFKSWRNTMAHGRDVTGDEYAGKLLVEVVTRSGKEKVLEITPESHQAKMQEVEHLLADFLHAKEEIIGMSTIA